MEKKFRFPKAVTITREVEIEVYPLVYSKREEALRDVARLLYSVVPGYIVDGLAKEIAREMGVDEFRVREAASKALERLSKRKVYTVKRRRIVEFLETVEVEGDNTEDARGRVSDFKGEVKESSEDCERITWIGETREKKE